MNVALVTGKACQNHRNRTLGESCDAVISFLRYKFGMESDGLKGVDRKLCALPLANVRPETSEILLSLHSSLL